MSRLVSIHLELVSSIHDFISSHDCHDIQRQMCFEASKNSAVNYEFRLNRQDSSALEKYPL